MTEHNKTAVFDLSKLGAAFVSKMTTVPTSRFAVLVTKGNDHIHVIGSAEEHLPRTSFEDVDNLVILRMEPVDNQFRFTTWKKDVAVTITGLFEPDEPMDVLTTRVRDVIRTELLNNAGMDEDEIASFDARFAEVMAPAE